MLPDSTAGMRKSSNSAVFHEMSLYCHLLSQSSEFSSNSPHFHNIINNGQSSTILETAGRSGILHGTCQRIVREDLNMHEVCTKNVSQLLTDDQKQLRLWPLES